MCKYFLLQDSRGSSIKKFATEIHFNSNLGFLGPSDIHLLFSNEEQEKKKKKLALDVKYSSFFAQMSALFVT